MPENTGVLRVAVLADGRLTLDGKLSSLDGLRESAKALRESNGTAWYYSEAPPKSSLTAMEVLRTLATTGFVIRFVSKPDFSDRV